MAYFANIGIKDSANLDSFSRLRVSNQNPRFDAQFTYDLQPLLFEQITAGSGATVTRDATNSCALMTFSSTGNGGKAYMQSYEHFRYTSGKSQLIFMTFNFVEAKANTLKFVGYSDGTNGIEFQNNGSVNRFIIYSNTTAGNEIANQADWNIDKLDGNGKSGILLDITKTQIVVIDFQALYVGRVRVGFDIGGNVIYVHEFNHANVIVNPYIKTANLPIRCGMTCTDTSSTTMNFICSSVTSEGGPSSEEGFDFTAEASVLAASGSRTHVLSIQPSSVFGSVTNRSKFVLENFNILAGANPITWELCLGDALTGNTSFIGVNTSYSGMEWNNSGVTSGAPSILVATGYVGSSNVQRGEVSATVPFKYPITLDASGNKRLMGRLTLLITGAGGTSLTRASFNWKEIR